MPLTSCVSVKIQYALTINPQRVVSGREPGYTQRLLIQRVRNVGALERQGHRARCIGFGHGLKWQRQGFLDLIPAEPVGGGRFVTCANSAHWTAGLAPAEMSPMLTVGRACQAFNNCSAMMRCPAGPG